MSEICHRLVGWLVLGIMALVCRLYFFTGGESMGYAFAEGSKNDTPVIYCNGSEDDLEALNLLREADLYDLVDKRGPVSEEKKTPFMCWPWFYRYEGLEGVKKFIEDYRKQFPYASA